MGAWIWFALAGVGAIFELLTFNLIFASLALGSVAGGVASLLTESITAHTLAFALTSVLSVTLFRPPLLRYLYRKTPISNTGTLALIGLPARTNTPVNKNSGLIMLRNEPWSARSEQGEIPQNTDVVIERIDGAIAIVSPMKSK